MKIYNQRLKARINNNNNNGYQANQNSCSKISVRLKIFKEDM